MKKILFILISIILFSYKDFSQNSEGYSVYAKVEDGDTIPYLYLTEVKIITPRIFKSNDDKKRFDKLVRNVKKAYPYAKLCEQKVMEYDSLLSKLTNESQKRKLMKQLEEEVKKQYSDEIKQLTFTQGKILLKLIDRQTGNSSYDLLKDYRGAVRAVFWQSIARIFGANLKSKYDKNGDDKTIEEIVIMIENGTI